MNFQAWEQNLKARFPIVYTWEDVPGTVYDNHTHKGGVVFYILAGSICMSFPDKKITLRAGDYFEVPVGVCHSAVVGELGCKFLVGQEIEGDA